MQRMTVQMETAPEENPRPMCDWNYKSDSVYQQVSYGDQVISTRVDIGDVYYSVYAKQRDKSDYKLNSIEIRLSDNQDYIVQEYFTYKLCQDKPTQEQMDILSEKAQSMLDQMGIGQWQVCKTEVQETQCEIAVTYQVVIRTVPVLNGTPIMLDQPALPSISDQANSANYARPEIWFQFSANGDLIYFDMQGLIETTQVINEGAAILPMDELLDKAKDYLSLTGIAEMQEYNKLSMFYPGAITCKVTLDNIDFTLARVKVENKDYTFYYTPALVIYGTARFYDKETGDLIESALLDPEPESRVLAVINAVDGSIVEKC